MFSKDIERLYKGLKDYAGTVINIVVVLITGGIEQLTSAAIYRCPCVDLSQLGPGCKPNDTGIFTKCAQRLNFGYGFAFIFAPAFALFVFSAAANPALWKSVTGYCHKPEKRRIRVRDMTVTYCSILIQSLISPVTWISIALFDGNYLACAITTLPYTIGEGEDYENCEQVFFNHNLSFFNQSWY